MFALPVSTESIDRPVMATPARTPPSNPSGSAVPAGAKPADPYVDEGLHGLWQKYGQAALVAAGIVLLVYVGKIGWDYVAQQREESLEAEFAQVKTPSQLREFVAAHPNHELAGVASLEIGDKEYVAGRIASALAAYADAARSLKGKPLENRAQLGLAMTQIEAGQTAAGQDVLRKILNDSTQLTVVRVAAGAQLASVAVAAGQADEARELVRQLMQIDPNSSLTQRAYGLTADLPGGTGIAFKSAAK
jgi:hypothetical protein